MSRLSTSFVLGFHGCDEDVGEAALQGKLELLRSEKDYDWLGPGVYFWEGDPHRAMEWAEDRVSRRGKGKPFVLGAVIDLRNCFDLLVRENLELLRLAYQMLADEANISGFELPKNHGGRDKLLRKLDCAVIKRAHSIQKNLAEQSGPSNPQLAEPFDTVRGLFPEGDEVYPEAGFRNLTHTQISVCNNDCIKGLFRPRLVGKSY